MNKKVVILLLLGMCLLIYLAISVIDIFVNLNKELHEMAPSTFDLTHEDSSIISKKYLPFFKVKEKYHNKNRNVFSQFLYNDQFQLLTYKIDLAKEFKMDSLFSITKTSVLQSNSDIYTQIQNGYYLFKFKNGHPSPVSKIFLTISGDSTLATVKNDTILNYKLLCENLSIRYSPTEPIDLYIVGKNRAFGTIKIPMDILFLLRNRKLFLLIMSPLTPDGTVPSDLLYNMIMGI